MKVIYHVRLKGGNSQSLDEKQLANLILDLLALGFWDLDIEIGRAEISS